MEYAFVNGATGVIGKHFAAEFASRGYKLFLTGRDGVKLSALKAELISRYKTEIATFVCDSTSDESRDRMYAFINASGIKFSYAALVAGVDFEGPFSALGASGIRTMLRVNAEATIEVASALIPRAAESMRIIVISSLASYFRMPLFALYSASKRTLYHFFLSLREELRGTGTGVTVVSPGAVRTRPDIIARIESQGAGGKLSCVPPEKLVRAAVRAADKGRAVYVPGLFNKFLRTLSFIVPAGLVSRVAGRRWRKKRR